VDSSFLEKLILKASLQSLDFLVPLSLMFDKDYFDDEIASNVFGLLQEHVKQYNRVAPTSLVKEEIEGSPEFLEEIDNIEFDVANNYNFLLTETNELLKERSLKQAILDSVEIINTGQERLKIRHLIEGALTKDLKASLGIKYFETLSERLRKIRTESVRRIPTYFPELDEFISGGFPPYTLSVLVSKIHSWKSATLANMISRQVLHGHNIAVMTMEMSELAFAQRFDGIFSKLDINRMYLEDEMMIRMIRSLKEVKEQEGRGEIYIKQFPTGSASTNDFRTYLRELRMRNIPIHIIYADYINLMRPEYKTKTDMYMDVKRIAEELRALSLEFDAPVVSVSQLNREGSRGDIDLRTLDLVYISESIGVPETADFVLIYGSDEENMVYESEIFYKICKNRFGGRVGEISKFYCDTRSLKLYDSTELDLWHEEAGISGDERNLAPVIETPPATRRRRG